MSRAYIIGYLYCNELQIKNIQITDNYNIFALQTL